jgi:hypothetical protein
VGRLSARFFALAEICYDADNGTGERRRSRHGAYRRLLRVQTINAEIRPTNVSRIISNRIIEILLSASSEGPGQTRAFLFEAQALRAGTRFFTFRGKLMEEWRVGANPRQKELEPPMHADARR